MNQMKVVLGFVAAVGGCGSFTKPNPLSCLDGYCSDQAHPFCDVDGTFGGEPAECIAVSCSPLELEACRGDEAIVCNAAGDDYDVTNCPFGCEVAAGGCKTCTPGSDGCDAHIIPRYLPTVCDEPAVEPTLTIAGPTMWNTNDDATCNGGVVAQLGGPEICVVRYGTISVERNQTLTVKGKRVLALVADASMSLDGVLDVSADKGTDGPGGGLMGSGDSGIAPAGSGGAGFKTRGGDGGTPVQDGDGMPGGAAVADPAQLPLIAGGPYANARGGLGPGGGGGGGGATLIACRGEVSVPGLVDAGGGGGLGGSSLFDGIPPGGGGAGGYVVFQGVTVVVTGQVFANGGGGGAGILEPGDRRGDGGDATRSDTVSAAGGVWGSHGTGGAGGRVGALPGDGLGAGTGQQGAAGGGSTGFVQTYTPPGVPPTLTPLAASPAFQPNLTIPIK